MEKLERLRQLMMASLDGEISREEREELEGGLRENPALRVEMRRMTELGQRLAGVRLKDPADAVMAELDASLLRRGGLPLGWLLLALGVLLIFAWLSWQWLFDPDLSAPMRWGGVALFAGLFVLLGVKIRERLIERRSDPYRDLIR